MFYAIFADRAYFKISGTYVYILPVHERPGYILPESWNFQVINNSAEFTGWFNPDRCCLCPGSFYPQIIIHGIDFPARFAPSQCETSLQSNAVSHWLGANLESALMTNGRTLIINALQMSREEGKYEYVCTASKEIGTQGVSVSISRHFMSVIEIDGSNVVPP